MIRPLSCIAAAAIVVGFASSSVRADTPNEITAVSYSEDPATATTRVRLRGALTPTFTVYKLEKPSRVVVDVPRARLSEALRGHDSASVFTASTWAVTTIAAQQLDDAGQLVRVIVTMARPGRYDVKTEGNEVVVFVTARDPAPPKVDGEALVKAQSEAERLRKVAAEQAARADAAQKAADEARKQGKLANAAELDRANAEAAKAKDLATRAQAQAEQMRLTAEKAKQVAQAEAAKAKQDADAARNDAAAAKRATDVARADADRAKRETDAARGDAARAKQETDAARNETTRAKQDADAARADATRAKEAVKRQADETERARLATEAAKQAALKEAAAIKAQAAREAEAARAQADSAKRDAERIRAEAMAQKLAAEKQLDAAARAQADVDKARREAETARQLAAKMKADADAARQEAVAARSEVSRTKSDADAAARAAEQARKEALAARGEIDRTKTDAEVARKEAIAARDEANRTKTDAKAEVARARAEADAAKADADKAKQLALQDRQNAERARTLADKLARDAKAQLATLEKKTSDAQALEDKARAANAAAEARDQAARDEVAKARREREAAEAAVKLATQRANDARNADRQKADADAKQAEQRLAQARKQTEEAERRRLAAEAAAQGAKKQLDQTRDALATVERQRSDAEVAAGDATRKRSLAEAAASDATRRRTEAETAANDASKRARAAEALRNDAEAQRKAAEEAARIAKHAADAAESQRVIAERSLRDATGAKAKAEKSLDELTTRRLAAERAATELEQRSKAEAKAQAEIAAATTRKATDAEIARMRTEAGKLADERKRAEADLADRRKAVAAQQQLSNQLEATAVATRDASQREEARLKKLTAQRQAEETALAKLKTDRDAATKLAVKPATVVVPKAGPKAKVTDIAFKGGADTGDVAIAFAGDAKVSLGEVGTSHVELFIDNAELAAKLERKLDVSRYGSPVKAISSFRDRKNPDRIRLIAELSQPATPTLERNATGASLRFTNDGPVAKRAPRVQAVPPQVTAGFGATSTPLAPQSVTQVPQGSRRRVYRGATVDFDFKDAPMSDLLRIIADTGRVNIVVPDTINAKVTVRLKRVPWDQALEVILSSHGLWYRREGNLFRIAPRVDLDKEDKEAAERAEAARKAETPRPEIVRLNYADAKDLAPKLKGMVSPNGTIEVDERQNALIINDVAGNRAEIARLAIGLDTQTPQISIEARIVEARSTFLRQIGVQWGGRATASPAGGNSTGLLFPNTIGLLGGNEDAQTARQGVATPSDFAINLPASTGSGEGGAIGLSLGSIGGNFALNLRLSALEDSGTVRIISAPKITVLNNKPAKITQGVSIPIQVISAAGTQTQLVQADLSLEVTPYVSSRDCAVQMKLNVTKNEPDFVNVGARGDPTFLRKEASTTMLVQDGDTSVLGGIYTRNSGLAYKKIPFFGDLPVLGWFFKNRRENDDRTEILVFITPKITNKAALACQ